MKRYLLVLTVLVLSLLSFACTTVIVTKGASVDGSIIVTHSADCGNCDFRLVPVPAMDYEPGSKRAVYPFLEHYPRYVGTDKGEVYNTPGYEPTEPLGYIDQVEHTYAYFDAVYGVINEFQLAIGECTCAANTYAQGSAECMFDIAALSRVAMERCKTAREAIELMGSLAVEYGYYGWGETLTVCDKNEAWVIEMCASPDQKSALWVAKKVPDGTVFVESNEFRIREVNPDDPDMMYSPNLFEVTAEAGWYDPETDEVFDWLTTVSPGEYSHPYYSLRRQWSIYNRLAPSMELSPWVESGYTTEYPFSITPEEKLSIQDVFALYRDHLEGTEFDLTQGLAAGPFGSPNRYEGGNKLVTGAWERAVSLFRCAYTFATQVRDWLPDPVGGVVWWGPDAAHDTVFVPFYCQMTEIPAAYSTGSLDEFDKDIAFWLHDFAGNWADLKWSYMIKDIEALQSELEGKEVALQPAVEAAAVMLYETDPELCKEYLQDYCINNANEVVARCQEFCDFLVTKYHDGYVNVPNIGSSVGYPAEWLMQVGYEDGPVDYRPPEERD
ncbi:MAG: hypothetical protein PWQ77_768 [Kosmotogales bacterium]|nr:hypothetical protein [Kosmotogales bacterium]